MEGPPGKLAEALSTIGPKNGFLTSLSTLKEKVNYGEMENAKKDIKGTISFRVFRTFRGYKDLIEFSLHFNVFAVVDKG